MNKSAFQPMGVISMLDEECVVPKGSDLTLASKLNDAYLNKHPNFEKPKPPKGKQAEAHFAMRQYAGTVRYNVTSWLEKNKDPLNDTVISVFKTHKGDNELIKTCWASFQTMEEASKGIVQPLCGSLTHPNEFQRVRPRRRANQHR